MSDALNFSSVAAKRILLLHRLRVRHLLGSLPPRTRRVLMLDLDDHLAEVLDHLDITDENERLRAALQRLGDPRDFLAPLVGNALFGDEQSDDGFMAMVSNAAALAMSGVKSVILLGINLVLGFIGSGMILFCLTTLMRPGRAGVFEIGADQYQGRIWGYPTEDPSLLPVWGSLFIGILGIAIFYFVQKWLRNAARALIAQTLNDFRRPDPVRADF
jgi:hypothetical protein